MSTFPKMSLSFITEVGRGTTTHDHAILMLFPGHFVWPQWCFFPSNYFRGDRHSWEGERPPSPQVCSPTRVADFRSHVLSSRVASQGLGWGPSISPTLVALGDSSLGAPGLQGQARPEPLAAAPLSSSRRSPRLAVEGAWASGSKQGHSWVSAVDSPSPRCRSLPPGPPGSRAAPSLIPLDLKVVGKQRGCAGGERVMKSQSPHSYDLVA